MRELYPRTRDELDAAARYRDDDRTTPNRSAWLLLNMITSTDGATALDGRSGGLATPPDRLVFHALRAAADVILVAAGTARTEGYGPVSVAPEDRDRRTQAGRAPLPRLAVVSASLDLDPGARLFSDPENRPLVYTAAAAPPDRRRALEPVAEVVDLGEDRVDVTAMMADLGRRGAGVVLCEGGPRLNIQLIEADLVDELCLTVSPMLVGGTSTRLAQATADSPAGADQPRHLRLDRVLEADSMLFLRYVRHRGDHPPGTSTA